MITTKYVKAAYSVVLVMGNLLDGEGLASCGFQSKINN
jgi:hypothetical protein